MMMPVTTGSLNRKPYRRFYLFEIFVTASFLAALAMAGDVRRAVWDTLGFSFVTFGIGALIPTLAGVAIRLALSARRGTARQYWRVIRSSGWLLDSLRILFFVGVGGHVYCWIKIQVPLVHPQLFDAQLWALDRVLFFGRSPNVFFLELFSSPAALHVIDYTYAKLFGWSIPLLFAVVLSSPSRRTRVAFADGNALLWLIGAWLYLAVPAVGPVYRYPDVWAPFLPDLANAAKAQAMLFNNYTQFIAPTRHNATLNILFGVAAFPSLHVGQMAFVFLWMRRQWRAGVMLFAIAGGIVAIGAIVTGWHYLVDVYAGLVLALLVDGLVDVFSRLRRAEAIACAVAAGQRSRASLAAPLQ
jgi:hypothetical protein